MQPSGLKRKKGEKVRNFCWNLILIHNTLASLSCWPGTDVAALGTLRWIPQDLNLLLAALRHGSQTLPARDFEEGHQNNSAWLNSRGRKCWFFLLFIATYWSNLGHVSRLTCDVVLPAAQHPFDEGVWVADWKQFPVEIFFGTHFLQTGCDFYGQIRAKFREECRISLAGEFWGYDFDVFIFALW